MQLPTKNKEDTSRCYVCHLRIGMPSKTHASLILGPSLASIVRRVSCCPDDAPNKIEALDSLYFTALDSPAYKGRRFSRLLDLRFSAEIFAKNEDEMFQALGCVGATRPRGPEGKLFALEFR